MIYVTAFVVAFLRVGLRTFQQHNVIGFKWAAVVPTSYLQTACDTYVIAVVAVSYDDLTTLVALALVMGTGGWIGAYAGMFPHWRQR